MDRRRLPLNALRAFEATARAGSFTAGATLLSVTQSALSRHVGLLERIVGQRLLVRDGRGVSLTEAGQTLLGAVIPAYDAIGNALDRLGAERTLHLHVPPSFLHAFAMPIIQRFRAECPELSINVISTNGFGAGGTHPDVSIEFDERQTRRAGELLWPIHVTPACAEAVAATLEAMPIEAMIRSQNLLHIRIEGQPPAHLWNVFAAQTGVGEVPDSGLVFESTVLAIDYARTGGGVALAEVRMLGCDAGNPPIARPFAAEVDTGYGYYLSLSPAAQGDPGALLLRDRIREALAV